MKPAGTFPGRQGVALRHQQSGLSCWGAGWGPWGDNPKAAPARPPLPGHGGTRLSKGRMRHKGGIPRAGCPLSPLPGLWGHSRTSPWLRAAGWGRGGGIPRVGCLVPHWPPVGTEPSLGQSSPAQPCHQPCTPRCQGGPWGTPRRPQPWDTQGSGCASHP